MKFNLMIDLEEIKSYSCNVFFLTVSHIYSGDKCARIT